VNTTSNYREHNSTSPAQQHGTSPTWQTSFIMIISNVASKHHFTHTLFQVIGLYFYISQTRI